MQHTGFELLGLKHLPALTQLQAQELSPYEVGEQRYRDSLDILMSSPAIVCALKQLDAFASLRKLLAHNDPGNLCVLMSPTPEMAFRQASLFFFQHDMIPGRFVDCRIKHEIHQICGHLLQRFPNLKSQHIHAGQYNSNKWTFCSGPQVLLTLCLFKLRVWNHSLATIARKLQQSGLVLVGLRVLNLDKTSATSLLPAESVTANDYLTGDWLYPCAKPKLPSLIQCCVQDPSDVEACVENWCSGSSLALCLKGQNTVRRHLDVLGTEDSSLLTTCDGAALCNNGIYGKFPNWNFIKCWYMYKNRIMCMLQDKDKWSCFNCALKMLVTYPIVSRSYEKAIQDVKRFFSKGLCCTETSTLRQEQVRSSHTWLCN